MSADDSDLPVAPRLALRRFTPDDLDWLHRLDSDPQAMRYLGGPISREETEKLLHERVLAYYDEHPGLGIWITIERASGAAIGFHLLNHLRGEKDIQVGYRLFPAWWGRGYATEMTIALLRYGFATLGLRQIVAITDRENLASQRVLAKSGLQRKADRAFPDNPAYAKYGPQAWFECDAAQWLAEHPHLAP